MLKLRRPLSKISSLDYQQLNYHTQTSQSFLSS